MADPQNTRAGLRKPPRDNCPPQPPPATADMLRKLGLTDRYGTRNTPERNPQ